MRIRDILLFDKLNLSGQYQTPVFLYEKIVQQRACPDGCARVLTQLAEKDGLYRRTFVILIFRVGPQFIEETMGQFAAPIAIDQVEGSRFDDIPETVLQQFIIQIIFTRRK